MQQNQPFPAGGYREIFCAAAEKAPAPARYLFKKMVTLWDEEYARLSKIVRAGGDFNEMTGRVYKAAAKATPKWQAIANSLDKLAKTDPAVRRSRDDLVEAQDAYLKAMAPPKVFSR